MLGQINDDAMASRLLDKLATAQTMSGLQDAIVLGRGWIAHDLSQQLSGLQGALRDFKGQQRYWENWFGHMAVMC